MNAFVVRESADLSKWIISLADNFFEKCPMKLNGSAYLLAARLLGFSYPDYLRYCATHGGVIVGSFPHAVFKDASAAQVICKQINEQWNRVFEIVKEEVNEERSLMA